MMEVAIILPPLIQATHTLFLPLSPCTYLHFKGSFFFNAGWLTPLSPPVCNCHGNVALASVVGGLILKGAWSSERGWCQGRFAHPPPCRGAAAATCYYGFLLFSHMFIYTHTFIMIALLSLGLYLHR